MLKKYVGDRQFYNAALTVAVPIMLQNLISNFVNMLDNIMVGQLGTEPMSGVAIVNQIVLVFNLAVFGGLGGIGIFTAQFFGKKDDEGLRYTFRCKTYFAVILCLVAIPLFIFADDFLINLFLHQSSDVGNVELALEYAKNYLYVAIIGLPPFAISNIFASTLRETGDTRTPVIAGSVAVAVNAVFNWMLIFGKCGFPALGVVGAAIATVMSRFVECFIILFYTLAKRNKFTYITGVFKSFKVPKSVLVPVLKKGSPLLINEIMWSAGMATLGIAYSMHGMSVVAAYSIASTVTTLFNMVFLSLGQGIGIMSGNLLGAGKHEEAVDTVRKLIAFSMFLSVCIGGLMFGLGGLITEFYETDENSRELAAYFIKTCAFTAPIVSFANASYFTLRSGGKTFITFLFDCGSLWIISIPVAFVLYYMGVNISIVFPVVQVLEFVKCVVGYIMIKKRIWVDTII